MAIRQTVCTIYEQRPQQCRDYPQPGHYRPPSCTFWFDEDGERQGECAEECNAACCRMPREGGEPGGAALPLEAGGLPCKYLGTVPVEEVVDQQDGVAKEAALLKEVYDGGLRDIRG